MVAGAARPEAQPPGPEDEAEPGIHVPPAGAERVPRPACRSRPRHHGPIDRRHHLGPDRLQRRPAGPQNSPEHPGADRPWQRRQALRRPPLGAASARLLARGPPLERLLGVARLPGERPDRALEAGVLRPQPRQHRLTDRHPEVTLVVVGRIVDGGEAEAPAERRRLRAAHPEERPQPRPVDRRHRREAVETCPSGHVHQDRLGLVGRGVPERDVARVDLGRDPEERRPPGLARPRRQTRPGRQLEADHPRREPALCREANDRLGLGGRGRAQAVIDVRDHQPDPETGRQEPQEAEERQRVRPPRARHHQPPTAEPREPLRRLVVDGQRPADLAERPGDRGVTRWHAIAAMIPCAP